MTKNMALGHSQLVHRGVAHNENNGLCNDLEIFAPSEHSQTPPKALALSPSFN
jgi:hypothetical protein